jgi:hypothetical protein
VGGARSLASSIDPSSVLSGTFICGVTKNARVALLAPSFALLAYALIVFSSWEEGVNYGPTLFD